MKSCLIRLHNGQQQTSAITTWTFRRQVAVTVQTAMYFYFK